MDCSSRVDISSCLDIPGWMNEDELLWLALNAARYQRIIEVGSWCGRSTRALALHTPGDVFCVDRWKDLDGYEPQNQYRLKDAEQALLSFTKNLSEFFPKGKIHVYRYPSLEAAKIFGWYEPFDMVFLDGDHSYETVAAEIKAYKPLLTRGGLLCGHDIGFPGVNQAVHELVGEFTCPAGQIWVAK